jgi:hypothetical protein
LSIAMEDVHQRPQDRMNLQNMLTTDERS